MTKMMVMAAYCLLNWFLFEKQRVDLSRSHFSLR